MITLIIALGSFVTCIYITYKAVELFEYKHCLNCPLKKDNEDIDFSCFAEDMKKDKEKFFNEKKI